MSQIFTWIWVGSGILLILLVLLHSPKGDGMGGIAASGSSMFTSASSAEASLNKITWTILIIFLSLAIILSAGWIQDQIFLYLKINIKKGIVKAIPLKLKVLVISSRSLLPFLELQQVLHLFSQANQLLCIQQ